MKPFTLFMIFILFVSVHSFVNAIRDIYKWGEPDCDYEDALTKIPYDRLRHHIKWMSFGLVAGSTALVYLWSQFWIRP